jgi:adenosine/AMP kinase
MHVKTLNSCEHIQVETMLHTMHALDDLATHLPNVPDCIFTNALLNSAIERLLRERGFDNTANALRRLAALIGNGMVPGTREAWPLSRTDA